MVEDHFFSKTISFLLRAFILYIAYGRNNPNFLISQNLVVSFLYKVRMMVGWSREELLLFLFQLHSLHCLWKEYPKLLISQNLVISFLYKARTITREFRSNRSTSLAIYHRASGLRFGGTLSLFFSLSLLKLQ
jgi:hypothetical protein